MPRVARIVLPGLPHHVTHRGNRRSRIFFTPEDRRTYLDQLALSAARYKMSIWAYCLMTNHVHLLVVPKRKDSMSRAIGRTHMMYARVIHARNGWTGHLWANRYYSAPVESDGAGMVARYIELNPVRAGLVSNAEDYPWSSASAHCSPKHDPVLEVDRTLASDPRAWRAWLEDGLDRRETERIRRRTRTGTPLGSDDFIAKLERTLGRSLTRRPYRRAPGTGRDDAADAGPRREP